ncbi:MAG: RNA-guided pseudouridylation complex pseudouridine synthase subunit Cbf5 [Caldivirga sp.]|jgi:H/ACA ribonucleoprotein complex subunit 4|uniref:RNA-guided pseudouridylation complex pseudouridine synthase subunit Cbf5 n=1 Tax=Caldivirga sp. TaxID=2080243 RepID=UPI003D0B3E61
MSSVVNCGGERVVKVKVNEDTDPRYGVNPYERRIEEYINYGFIILDKPRGPTSSEVVAWVKKMLNISRAGHSGTLDPGVSGVLPIALGDSTKVLQGIGNVDKEYVGVMLLHSMVDQERVKAVFREFTGKIYQRPPLKSAVKRRIRVKTIYSLDIMEFDGRYVLFKADVESGTYIRKLCYDIGEVLGVGASMRELRRTRVGCFREENAVNLDTLREAYWLWRDYGDESLLRRVIRPVEEMVAHLPRIYIRDSAVDAVAHGASLAAPGVAKVEEGIKSGQLVALMTLKGELVALAESTASTDSILSMSKGIVAKPTRVIMPRGVYPSTWRRTSKQASN